MRAQALILFRLGKRWLDSEEGLGGWEEVWVKEEF